MKCTTANWNDVAYAIPRTKLDEYKERDDLKQSRVYFLFDTSYETGKGIVVYRTSQMENAHYIRNSVLEQVVLEAIENLSDFVRCYEWMFLYLIERQKVVGLQENTRHLERTLEANRSRVKAIDNAIAKLFESNIEGKISDERFLKLTANYESEQKQLEAEIKEVEAALSKSEQAKTDLRLLLKGLRDFTEVKKLTPEIVNTLIKRIEVHNSEKRDGHKLVKVDIYFTAVGMINLPTEKEISEIMKEMQKKSA